MSDVQPETQPAVEPAVGSDTSQVETQPAAPAAPAAPADPPAKPQGIQDTYEGLTWEARRLAGEGRWVFGVNMGGAFVVLTDKKLGGVDDDLKEAANPGFKKNRADAYLNELLGRS